MMRTSRIVGMALDNLKQRKLRTTLTTLGVIIGITTIIALASLGEGFRFDVKRRMETGFELNVLIVFPGSVIAGFGQPFTPTDVNSIRNVTNVSLATPMITLPYAKILRNQTEQLGAFTVGAINFSDMQQMLPQRFQVADGDFPASGNNDTVVLGYKAGTRNGTALVNVGENVTFVMINTQHNRTIVHTMKVSGILQPGGTAGITNFDYWAFIPLDTAVQMLGSESYQIILVKVSDPQDSEQTASNIEKTFANPYAISIFVPSSFMRQVDNVLNLIQIFLMAVASISLLVAGIGIMNIMTVSVMERTREVGILKAIGAKSQTVLSMFLTEATLIGIIGGLIGMFTGYGLSFALAYGLSSLLQPQRQDTLFQAPETEKMTIEPIFSPEWTVIAFVFAIVICVIFGLYPARKAVNLDPVKALHYE